MLRKNPRVQDYGSLQITLGFLFRSITSHTKFIKGRRTRSYRHMMGKPLVSNFILTIQNMSSVSVSNSRYIDISISGKLYCKWSNKPAMQFGLFSV
jgi:hypothetical protein